jgi:hypothetical protein
MRFSIDCLRTGQSKGESGEALRAEEDLRTGDRKGAKSIAAKVNQ